MEMKKEKYFDENTVTNIIFQRALNSRKISRVDNLDFIVAGLIYAVNEFNLIEENQYTFDAFGTSMRVEDLKIPKELAFMLIPMSIRINPLDLKTRDIKVTPKYLTRFEKKFNSYNEYIDLVNRFRGYFKRNGNEDLVSVVESRKHVALFDILDKVCMVNTQAREVDDHDLVNASVHYFNNDFWPYLVNNSIKTLFECNYFNTTFKELSNDYLFHLDFC